MKITMPNGFIFEGTQAEYEAFLAFAEAQQTEEIAEIIEFEGEQYRKVDRKAQAGDVVVFTNVEKKCGATKDGAPYEVYYDGELRYKNGKTSGNMVYGWNGSCPNPNVYEKVEAEYVPQEGEIVVITDIVGSNVVKKGDIGIVREVSVDGTVRVNPPNTPNRGNWVYAYKLRKATPAEVEAYEKAVADVSKPKLKAGDFVKFEEPDLYDITVGKIYEVKADDDGDLCIIDDAGDEDYSHLAAYAIKVDAEEVAKHVEAEKWAQIGRNPFEMKKGDVVRVTDPCGAEIENGRVFIAEHDGDIRSVSIEGWHVYTELIAPVESTLK